MSEASLTLTVPEVARRLGISRGLAYQLARRGELPVLRLGKRLVIPRKAFDRLLEQAGQEAAVGSLEDN